MSRENHPNFHAVGFATDITSSFYERLRVSYGSIDEKIQEEIRIRILEFISEIEGKVDRSQGD